MMWITKKRFLFYVKNIFKKFVFKIKMEQRKILLFVILQKRQNKELKQAHIPKMDFCCTPINRVTIALAPS